MPTPRRALVIQGHEEAMRDTVRLHLIEQDSRGRAMGVIYAAAGLTPATFRLRYPDPEQAHDSHPTAEAVAAVGLEVPTWAASALLLALQDWAGTGSHADRQMSQEAVLETIAMLEREAEEERANARDADHRATEASGERNTAMAEAGGWEALCLAKDEQIDLLKRQVAMLESLAFPRFITGITPDQVGDLKVGPLLTVPEPRPAPVIHAKDLSDDPLCDATEGLATTFWTEVTCRACRQHPAYQEAMTRRAEREAAEAEDG